MSHTTTPRLGSTAVQPSRNDHCAVRPKRSQGLHRSAVLSIAASLLIACHQPPHIAADLNTSAREATQPEQTLEPAAPHSRSVPAITPQLAIVSVRPDQVWDALRDSFRLDHNLDSPAVTAQINWLKRHPHYFQQRAAAFARYMPYIADELSAYDIPGELALMPVIESALDPYAYSPGGAAGLWQFISITAERFDLQRNHWYDGRRDVVAATDAAISYLSFLYQSFDDWLLVMAGYNAGEGTVRRSLRRYASTSHSAGTNDDHPSKFWRMSLPRETRQYVPRILAYAAVIADPARYGVTLPDIPHQPGFQTVTLPGQYDLMKIADTLALSLDDLYALNPALNQWATPAEGPHRLIIPAELDAVTATAQLAAIPERDRMGWKRIKVAAGDTLGGLAQRHGADLAGIRKANRLKSDRIRVGQALYIPKSSIDPSRYPIARLTGGTSHTVSAGDSLWSIARKHDVRISQLVRWNELNPKKPLRLGQQIHVGATDRAVVRKVRYKVRQGDSLSRIASRFKVSTGDIARWNSLDAKRYLKPGQRLTLHVTVASAGNRGSASTAGGL
ncbi:MAG: LysM peptidoglycan-binding domain-containing protein [Pseudomonadales bacterium]